MTEILAPAAVALGTLVMRAAGPLYLGGRSLAPRLRAVIELLPVPLLAGLVVTQAFAAGQHLVIDGRLAGLVAAALLVAFRAPLPVTVIAGAAAAAAVRYLGWLG